MFVSCKRRQEVATISDILYLFEQRNVIIFIREKSEVCGNHGTLLRKDDLSRYSSTCREVYEQLLRSDWIDRLSRFEKIIHRYTAECYRKELSIFAIVRDVLNFFSSFITAQRSKIRLFSFLFFVAFFIAKNLLCVVQRNFKRNRVFVLLALRASVLGSSRCVLGPSWLGSPGTRFFVYSFLSISLLFAEVKLINKNRILLLKVL